MKVSYPVKEAADLKTIKETLKPFGGRCAKMVDGLLEFQIKEENEQDAYAALRSKGFVE